MAIAVKKVAQVKKIHPPSDSMEVSNSRSYTQRLNKHCYYAFYRPECIFCGLPKRLKKTAGLIFFFIWNHMYGIVYCFYLILWSHRGQMEKRTIMWKFSKFFAPKSKKLPGFSKFWCYPKFLTYGLPNNSKIPSRLKISKVARSTGYLTCN